MHFILSFLTVCEITLLPEFNMTCHPQRSPEFVEWIDWGSIQTLSLMPRSPHLEM